MLKLKDVNNFISRFFIFWINLFHPLGLIGFSLGFGTYGLFGGLALIVIAIFFMLLTKNKYKEISQDPLTIDEKIIIWIICFFNFFTCSVILYFGWKKLLPIKTKQLNSILLRIIIIYIILAPIASILFLMNAHF